MDAVLAGVGDARKIADLFAGLGTFTFPLAMRAAVHAVEGDAPAMSTLSAAARSSANVTTERRDLFDNPLTASELSRFDAVVFAAPRRCPRTIQPDRSVRRSNRGGRFLQPRHLRPRCPHPDRRRLPPGTRHPGGPVRLVRPRGTGRPLHVGFTLIGDAAQSGFSKHRRYSAAMFSVSRTRCRALVMTSETMTPPSSSAKVTEREITGSSLP